MVILSSILGLKIGFKIVKPEIKFKAKSDLKVLTLWANCSISPHNIVCLPISELSYSFNPFI